MANEEQKSKPGSDDWPILEEGDFFIINKGNRVSVFQTISALSDKLYTVRLEEMFLTIEEATTWVKQYIKEQNGSANPATT
jgi:hypothetical protein